MQITIEVPDTVKVVTYQYVYIDEEGDMSIHQAFLDGYDIDELRRQKE